MFFTWNDTKAFIYIYKQLYNRIYIFAARFPLQSMITIVRNNCTKISDWRTHPQILTRPYSVQACDIVPILEINSFEEIIYGLFSIIISGPPELQNHKHYMNVKDWRHSYNRILYPKQRKYFFSKVISLICRSLSVIHSITSYIAFLPAISGRNY